MVNRQTSVLVVIGIFVTVGLVFANTYYSQLALWVEMEAPQVVAMKQELQTIQQGDILVYPKNEHRVVYRVLARGKYVRIQYRSVATGQVEDVNLPERWVQRIIRKGSLEYPDALAQLATSYLTSGAEDAP